MFSPRSSFTRVLATLLPFCFAWGFVACVSLCSSPGEELNEDTVDYAASIADAHENEHCSIPAALSCTLPARHLIAPPQQVGNDAEEVFFASPPLASALYLSPRLLSPPPASDPPLERLGMLRI